MKDLDVIEAQLTRVLGFFPRIDTKISGLFAVNTAILTISALNVEAGDFMHWYIAIPGVCVFLGLVVSYAFLYRCNFPQLEGAQGSLLYFKTIQERTEVNYLEEFEAIGEDAYRSDLLSQVWQNSNILTNKYESLTYAIRFTLATLIPFAIFLSLTAIEHSRLPLVAN